MKSLVGEWERLASLARRGFLQGITLDIKGRAKTEHRHVLAILTVKVASVTGTTRARGRRAGDELTEMRSLRPC